MEIDMNKEHWEQKKCPQYDCRKKQCECGLEKVFLSAALGDDSKDSPVAPKNGEYCNAIVVYEANGHVYIYSQEGIPTLVESEGTNVEELIEQLEGRLDQEVLDRQAADNVLQGEIDDIKNSPDVVDIVPTYAALQAYDTSKLGDNDIVRVLQDENHDGQSTYYRWNKQSSSWTYIGAVGDYYTKGQVDTLLAGKQDELTAGANISIAQVDNDLVISATDTTYTAGTNVSISSGNVISATDTTYSDFTGTDGNTDGTAGLVPAPLTTDAGKFLKADGTWATAGGGDTITILTSADYNYPINNPNGVSLGLLNEGFYRPADDTVYIYENTRRNNRGICLYYVSGTNSNNVKFAYVFYPNADVSSGDYKINTLGYDPTTGATVSWANKGILSEDYVVDNLNSNASERVLSAKQGKALKDLIAGTPYYIDISDLPTVGNVATGKSLYVAASMTAGDKISGQQFFNIVTNTSPNDRAWKLVVLDTGQTPNLQTHLYLAEIHKANPNVVSPSPSNISEAVFSYYDGTEERSLRIWASGTGNNDFNYALDAIGGGGGGGDTVYSDKTTSNTSDGGAVYIGPLNANQEEQADPTTTDNHYKYFWALPFDPGGSPISAPGNETINIGGTQSSGGSDNVTLGYRASCIGSYNTIIGHQAISDAYGSSVCVGNSTTCHSNYSIALGRMATVSASNVGSIALGSGAETSRGGEINVGTNNSYKFASYNNTGYRVIGGVHDPIDAHDAATKGYVDSHAGGPVTLLTSANYNWDSSGQGGDPDAIASWLLSDGWYITDGTTNVYLNSDNGDTTGVNTLIQVSNGGMSISAVDSGIIVFNEVNTADGTISGGYTYPDGTMGPYEFYMSDWGEFIKQSPQTNSGAPGISTEGNLGQLYTDTDTMHTYQCTAIDDTDPDNIEYTWTQRW